MPDAIRAPVSYKSDWHAHAVYLRTAWLWRWWWARPKLVARVVGRFRNWADVVCQLDAAEEEMPTMPTMPNADGAPPIPYAEMGEWEAKYPRLAGYMVDPVWPDGKTRKPGRLFIGLENGMWVVTLKEPALGYILRAVVTYPDEMFGALEGLLALPRAPWMVDPWEPARNGKKK